MFAKNIGKWAIKGYKPGYTAAAKVSEKVTTKLGLETRTVTQKVVKGHRVFVPPEKFTKLPSGKVIDIGFPRSGYPMTIGETAGKVSKYSYVSFKMPKLETQVPRLAATTKYSGYVTKQGVFTMKPLFETEAKGMRVYSKTGKFLGYKKAVVKLPTQEEQNVILAKFYKGGLKEVPTKYPTSNVPVVLQKPLPKVGTTAYKTRGVPGLLSVGELQQKHVAFKTTSAMARRTTRFSYSRVVPRVVLPAVTPLSYVGIKAASGLLSRMKHELGIRYVQSPQETGGYATARMPVGISASGLESVSLQRQDLVSVSLSKHTNEISNLRGFQ